MTELEFQVIDTPAFQRLRRIKQLALAHLGFPGAMHTRFEHCIGVMHVAWRIIEHLRRNEGVVLSATQVQIIRLAGLLHDIGHGPFSHVSEILLRHFNPKTDDLGDMEEIHEEISRRIIAQNEEIQNHIDPDVSDTIVKLLSTNEINLDFQHDVLSGPLDADKMDYLLRDSYYTGVKYGVFDLDRMINIMTLAPEGDRKRLAVRMEGIQTVEQYVMAKYFIANQVYQHKSRHITDLLLVDGIRSAIEDGNKELGELYKYNDTSEYIRSYLEVVPVGWTVWRQC